MQRLVYLFVLILTIPTSYAKSIKHKQLSFTLDTDSLIKGETHYYLELLSPRKLALKYPVIFELDSLSLIQESQVKMLVTKSVSVINKPVGFFDEQELLSEKFLSYLSPELRFKKINQESFLVSSSQNGLSYKTQTYFDADDLSTLPNSKVTRAISAVKKLDIISQGASMIVLTERTSFSHFTEGSVAATSYIPLKENKTMRIEYNLWAVKEDFSKVKELEENFVKEQEEMKARLDSYK